MADVGERRGCYRTVRKHCLPGLLLVISDSADTLTEGLSTRQPHTLSRSSSGLPDVERLQQQPGPISTPTTPLPSFSNHVLPVSHPDSELQPRATPDSTSPSGFNPLDIRDARQMFGSRKPSTILHDLHPAPMDGVIDYPSIPAQAEPPRNTPGTQRPLPGDFPDTVALALNMVADYPVSPLDGAPHESTSINGGLFIGGNVNNIERRGELGLHILHRAVAGDALHNSADRYPQPKCHPNTRMKMLDVLWDWSCGTGPPRNWTSEEDDDWRSDSDSDSESDGDDESLCEDDPDGSVIWLHGPAGAGKSAIAQSFCQKLEAEGRLGGSFFFKRGHPSRGNAKKLFPTIAYQLSLLLPQFKSDISNRIEDDQSLLDRSYSLQLQNLIIEPCQQITPAGRTFVIIIDGLDECEGQKVQQEILRLIGNAVQEHKLPLRFLIASRPEPHIRQIFREPCGVGFCRLNIQQSFADVRRYLRDEFARIHEEHETMTTISSPWPSLEVIETLVDKSSGYFIYASTVVKYVDDDDFRPTERLSVIMGIKEPDSTESPFSPLDHLYTQILSDAPARPQLLEILAVIAAKFCLRVSHIEQLLDLKPGDVRLILRRLHSVINLPPSDDDPNLGVTFHHASFLDFITHPIRSHTFFVGGPQRRIDLACHLLKAFSYTYQDPIMNSSGHVAWELGSPAFKYIASTQPSPDLVSLFYSLNPDFLFYVFYEERLKDDVEMVLAWLKKIEPRPDTLIQLWKDYHFMLLCDSMWMEEKKFMGWGTNMDLQNCREVLSKAPPQLLKILHAYRLVPDDTMEYLSLFNIHFLLDLSWDELRKAICPLRTLMGGDKRGLSKLLSSSSDPILFRGVRSGSTLRDFVWGSIRIMKKVFAHELSRELRGSTWAWGRLLRACPPCLDLLHEIELASADSAAPFFEYCYWEDLSNILEWLKMFPQPPLSFISRFEDHVEAMRSEGEEHRPDFFEDRLAKWHARRKG
ncbi:hypothetical protein C8R44DRAFT_369215 [Mycena epipterygia]|nr:hypothetical protein C8R44DRAFT_369215 [Mycena epipterygia]